MSGQDNALCRCGHGRWTHSRAIEARPGFGDYIGFCGTCDCENYQEAEPVPAQLCPCPGFEPANGHEEICAHCHHSDLRHPCVDGAIGCNVDLSLVRPVPMDAEASQVATLRDQFAMAALGGLLAGRNNQADATLATWSADSYRFADAMMKARGDS